MTKVVDATSALVTVVQALEPLTESDRQWVLQSVASKWSVNIQLTAPNGSPMRPGSATTQMIQSLAGNGEAAAAIANKDIRTFMRIKKPATDVERVACLIYYLAKTTGQVGCKSKDISQANIDFGGTKFNMTRALDNATRRSKYLSSRGAQEKQLTPLGEDVVEALPDQAAVAAVIAESRVRKVPKKKATKKKK